MPENTFDISFTQNRELSWLKFNERVLEEAMDEKVALLERLKFLGIFDSNLDEFFMIRVGSLHDMSLMKKDIIDNKSNLNQREQIEAIMKSCGPLYQKKDETYIQIERGMRTHNIRSMDIAELTKDERSEIEEYFYDYIVPILSPQIIDRHHPFPHLQNLSLHIILDLEKNYHEKGESKEHAAHVEQVGIVPVPAMLPKYIWLSDGKTRYILIEKIIYEFVHTIFTHYRVKDKHIVCVTRNADINPNDDDFGIDDYRGHMRKILKKRERLAPVRLETNDRLNDRLMRFMLDSLKLKERDVFITKSPLKMGYVFQLIDDLPQEFRIEHTYHRFDPQPSLMIDPNRSMTEQVKRKDLILSFPYESMDPFIRLLEESSVDPCVISIKITIYRLSSNSKVAEQLIRAAENGKQVTVLMELRARFDEQNNIDWAIRLEQAGCNIIYGFENYKVHSKVCLITRIDDGEINYIIQVGTGNYNEKTAKQYTDFSFMSANIKLGEDGVRFFNNMSIGNVEGEYRHLLVAPLSMQRGLYYHIEEEIEKAKRGERAYILLKMNSISDRKLIDFLSKASCAGVKVDLIIRGICCILPDIKNRTENIRIISVVGRFLEHHRVYCFGEGKDAKIYISSADFMTRNIRKRVEVACPIYDYEIKEKITKFLKIMLKDNVKGRLLKPDGSFILNPGDPETKINSQKTFMILATKATKKRDIDAIENRYEEHRIEDEKEKQKTLESADEIETSQKMKEEKEKKEPIVESNLEKVESSENVPAILPLHKRFLNFLKSLFGTK